MAQLEEIKKILRSLLVSAPVRVTVSTLSKDFRNIEGYNIPYSELGYNSLLHMLHSIPDVLRVNGSSIESEVILVVNEKVAHVSEMVMKQKKPSKGRSAHAPIKSIIREFPSYGYYSGVYNSKEDSGFILSKHDTENSKSTYSDFKNINRISPFPRPLLPKKQNLPSFTKHYPSDIERLKSNFNETIKTVGSDNSEKNYGSTLYSMDECPKQTLDKCERVPSLSQHTLRESPNADSNIEKKYSAVSSRFEKLKLRALKNNTELNNIEIQRKYSRNKLSGEKEVLIIENDDDNKVPLEVQNKLKKLIKQYPSGIQCTDLPVLYKEKYYKSLEYQTYGFDRLISLCFNLENIFYCVPESDCDFKLYDVDNPPLKKNSSDQETSSETFKSNIITTVDLSQIKGVKSKDWDVYADWIPQDSIALGDVIENNSLNEYIIGETVQIVLSEIFNPSKFWIYKNDGQLNESMNSMQTFYRDNKKNYIIPDFLMEIGLYCVVHTLNEFQRAIIVDLLHEIGGYVKVYLIDFGTLANLPREKVWFLSKKFCTLPPQAVETNLAGIQPKDGIWSKQCILRFKDMVISKHIFAKIIDKKDGVLSVHIAVSSMPLQTLNDLLVKEGYAEYIANCAIQVEKNPRKKMIERIRLRNQRKSHQ